MSLKFSDRVTQEWLDERTKEDGDCVIWKYSCNASNQPRYTFKENGKSSTKQIRRYVWELNHGDVEWEDGHYRVVTVTCDNPRCLNPDHLKLTTKRMVITKMSRTVNVRAKKFAAQALVHRATAKITMEQARYVRNSDKPLMTLASELGVSFQWLSRIRRGEVWRELQASPFAGLMGG